MRLIVFARVPRLGRVKTRLAHALGEAATLVAYRALLEHALSAASSVDVSRELCLDSADEFGECAGLARRFAFELTGQPSGDLGQRMAQSMAPGLARGERVVLMGTDCPALDGRLIGWCFDQLLTHDAVFVPVEDGGYCLVGLRRPVTGIFDDDLPWSTSRVMELTRERLRQSGNTWAESDTLWDVDSIEDWRRWDGRTGYTREALTR